MHAFENLKKANDIIPGVGGSTYAHSQMLLCIVNQEILSLVKYPYFSSYTTTLSCETGWFEGW